MLQFMVMNFWGMLRSFLSQISGWFKRVRRPVSTSLAELVIHTLGVCRTLSTAVRMDRDKESVKSDVIDHVGDVQDGRQKDSLYPSTLHGRLAS
jgi:hypothetical protein